MLIIYIKIISVNTSTYPVEIVSLEGASARSIR